MPASNYPAHVFEPRHLTTEEIENPYWLLAKYYDFGHITDQREFIQHFFDMTVTGSYFLLNRRERADFVYSFHWLEKALEALYLLHINYQKEIERTEALKQKDVNLNDGEDK